MESGPRIFSVSELTSEIKSLLENRFDMVWITGEISNFRKPTSGHFYFSLKDASAQIQAVMFRGQNRNLKFTPEDGMAVMGLGRISVYEPRGNYQIIFEYLEPRGAGARQLAFEQLKAKLAGEGLFEVDRKKALPFLPGCIGVVTSVTGAVIHDILHVTNRRFPNMRVRIVPVKVQGDGAEDDIVRALSLLNRREAADVILVARGGGSIEDLAAFNSEPVARAIAASRIPVVSGVGHETDVTIADFVADVRAPTPSAAAEIVVPLKDALVERTASMRQALAYLMRQQVARRRETVARSCDRLIHPRRRIQDKRLRLDDLSVRLAGLVRRAKRENRSRLGWLMQRLSRTSPMGTVSTAGKALSEKRDRLEPALRKTLDACRKRLEQAMGRLAILNPAAILSRGYSIALKTPENTVVKDAAQVVPGQTLKLVLAAGSLRCRIERTFAGGDETDL